MAQIPLGNFGNVLPQAQAGRVLSTGADQVADAVGRFGQVGMQASAKELNEQKRKQDEENGYRFSVEAAHYGAEYSDIQTEVEDQLSKGLIDEGTASKTLFEKNNELTAKRGENIPQDLQDKFKAYSAETFLRSTARIKPIAMKVAESKANTELDLSIENILKIKDTAQSLATADSIIDRATITLDKKLELKSSVRQRREISEAKATVDALTTLQDVDGLQKIIDNVDSIYPNMKIETRDAYVGQLRDAQDKIFRAKEIEQKQILAEAKQVADAFRTDAYTGYPIAPEKYEEILGKVKGTEYEAQVREDLTLNKAAQDFRKQSPMEQERRIESLTSELENNPQSDASLLEKQLSMFKGIADASKQRANNDPIGQLQSQTGKKLHTVTPEQLASGQVDFKQAQITTQLLAEQKQKNGGQGSLIQWNDTERKAIVSQFINGSVKKQETILNGLTKMAGNNKEAQLEYFKLIDKDSPLDYVGIAKLNQMGIRLLNTDIQVSSVMLEGKHLIGMGEDKLIASRQALDLAIAPEFGNTTTAGQQAYSTYSSMAYSAYVGLAKRYPAKVQYDKDGKPLINKELAKKAFDMTTGGTYKQKFGKNTNAVFMPYGFTESSFEDHIENHFRTTFKKETDIRYDYDILGEYAVRQKKGSNSIYEFVTPEGKVFKNPRTNQDYAITINPIYRK